MTAEPTPSPDPASELVQMNVRVPRGLRDAVDARRANVNGGISRDKWVAKALTFALQQPIRRTKPTTTAPGMRTAPPPHRRP